VKLSSDAMRAMCHRAARIRTVVTDCAAPSAPCSAAAWPVPGALGRRCGRSAGAARQNAGLAVGATRCLCPAVQFRGFSSAPRGESEDERSEAPAQQPAPTQHVSPINIPNALTLSRILATPVFIHWINLGHYDLVLGGFFAAAVTDFFDGCLLFYTALHNFLAFLARFLARNSLPFRGGLNCSLRMNCKRIVHGSEQVPSPQVEANHRRWVFHGPAR